MNTQNDSNNNGTPAKGEVFVGLNILSKIGVIFIILGVIAFSAISSQYMPPAAWAFTVFVPGLLLTALGEVFYRIKSSVFAKALTMGGVAELYIAVIIAAGDTVGLPELAMLGIAVAVSAGGILLSYRYKTQSVLIVTAVVGVIPLFGTGGYMVILAAVYLLLLQAAALFMADKLNKPAAVYVLIIVNFITAIAVQIKLSHIFIERIFAEKETAALVFTVLSFGMFAANVLWHAVKLGGLIDKSGLAVLCISASLAAVMGFFFVWSNAGLYWAGGFVLIYGAVWAAVMLLCRHKYGRNKLCIVFENIVMGCLSVGLLTVMPGRYAFCAFSLFAGAVLLFSYYKEQKMYRVWGYVICGIAEFFFVCLLVSRFNRDEFILHFLLNAAIWTAVMVCLVKLGKRSTGNTAFYVAAVLNDVFLALYAVAHFVPLCIAFMPSVACQSLKLVLSALVWMLGGFVYGKLRFLGKTAVGSSAALYVIGFFVLISANVNSAFLSERSAAGIIAVVAVNIVSVLCVLDMTLVIGKAVPKFSKAIGLVVSGYALFTLTIVLATNSILAFTSCIISIVYILTAAAWIWFGFWRRNAVLRRFGLALALLSSGKLFLFDFSGINDMGRTLMFIGFGIVLLVISFGYAFLEKSIKK